MENDYVETYKSISAKLKKRNILLRKPPYPEAAEQFQALSLSLKRKNPKHPYAAFCLLALAKCEQALKNTTMEAIASIDAGHIYWSNQLDSSENAVLGFEEDLTQAVHCYLLAIKIYLSQKKFGLAASFYYEMADHMKTLEKLADAADYFQEAAQLQQTDSPMTAILSLQQAVSCNIRLRDYKSSCAGLIWAIKLASEVVSAPQPSDGGDAHSMPTLSSYGQVLIECRVSLVLLLILQGDFLQAKDFVKKVADDATSCGFPAGYCAEFITLLNALVIGCERRVFDCAVAVQRELCRSLTTEQNDILMVVLNEMQLQRNIGPE
eukprot:TRINITY_DN764_c0_g2_i1.p1 TRINITY_DN764_c0_g2~~TRINITY_DN764_c0_g2_i1.p1  ORF type:complete len:322 (+),score=73.62 TRINITY_DN764_c0_g2_i1:47-1012(+)